MKKTEQEIRKISAAHEIDLVGFVKANEINLAYPPRAAEKLLPGAKTVIAFAAALLRGALDCPEGTKGAIKDSQIAYDRVQNAAAAVGRYLERNGHNCYFPPASMPVDALRGKGGTFLAAEFSQRQAAIGAGLGVKGWNNLLVTPEYGPRVRIGSLITTAAFEFEPRKLPDDICNGCGKCVKVCPVGALSPKGEFYLNQPKCKNHYVRPFLDHTPLKTIKNIFSDKSYFFTGLQSLMEGYYFSCAECQRVCPVGKNNCPDLN